MRLSRNRGKTIAACLLTMGGLAMHSAALSAGGQARTGGGTNSLDPRFDTSFAVEYSYACTSGGCHETDAILMEEYGMSFMTHTMVKCDACHGTHTADLVGEEKPNLTGYFPGIGATGYQVGDDRCIACHTATFDRPDHRNKTRDCAGCHAPHRFAARNDSNSR